jgi:hypothetical protein
MGKKRKERQKTLQMNRWLKRRLASDANFIQLTLGIPEKPIFRDDDGGLVIPQEPLVSVLKKFDGVTFSDALSRSEASQRKRYRLLELPQYLILHLARIATLEKRFTQW